MAFAKTNGEHSSTWKYFNDHHDHYHDLVNDNDHDDHLNDDVKHGDKRKSFVSRSKKTIMLNFQESNFDMIVLGASYKTELQKF